MENKLKEKNYIGLFTSFSIILFILMILSLLIGKYEIKVKDVFIILFKALTRDTSNIDLMSFNVIINLRLPRVLASVFVGASLSISGACYQGIFKNPLVSPDFLGVSSGASIGAAISILLGLSSVYISIFSFIGGIISVLITILISIMIKNRTNIVLVLSGIIVSSLMSSILGFLKYFADPNGELQSITYWTMGDFSYVTYNDLLMILIVMIPSTTLLLLISWWIDVLATGETDAKLVGANVKLIRGIAIVCATLLTASSICISGTIGWVGLIIPHFSRLLVGESNRKVLPFSLVIGGIFMLLVDSITRIIGVTEMPISIMTGLIGAPIFIWLLFKKRDEVL